MTDTGSGRSTAELADKASRLVSEERWTEALAIYDEALARDPSLQFAQAGRAAVAPRAELGKRLQALIERPERLAADEVRVEAERLLARARALPNQGPVIRSQVSRLELLLPTFNQPIVLALESDNATEVAIQRVGFFGAFDRREVTLKPGKYTVTGKRSGFRDVRREITVSPGQGGQTIVIRCLEPILMEPSLSLDASIVLRSGQDESRYGARVVFDSASGAIRSDHDDAVPEGPAPASLRAVAGRWLFDAASESRVSINGVAVARRARHWPRATSSPSPAPNCWWKRSRPERSRCDVSIWWATTPCRPWATACACSRRRPKIWPSISAMSRASKGSWRHASAGFRTPAGTTPPG